MSKQMDKRSGECSDSKTQSNYSREQKQAVEALAAEPTCDNLWKAMAVFAGYPFYTAKGLEFSYTVKKNPDGGYGKELFVDRKEKSITRATADVAFLKVQKLREAAEGDNQEPPLIRGPKQLGVFGASYLYPIFEQLGVLRCS